MEPLSSPQSPQTPHSSLVSTVTHISHSLALSPVTARLVQANLLSRGSPGHPKRYQARNCLNDPITSQCPAISMGIECPGQPFNLASTPDVAWGSQLHHKWMLSVMLLPILLLLAVGLLLLFCRRRRQLQPLGKWEPTPHVSPAHSMKPAPPSCLPRPQPGGLRRHPLYWPVPLTGLPALV